MRFVVLGGAGAMGQVIVRDLVESEAVKEVVVADLSRERADRLKRQLGSDMVQAASVDLTNHQALVALLTGATAVINSTPYKFNVQVMEAALAAGCHYLDLGGLFHTTRKQLELSEKFKTKNLTAVLGMGAAPGITNVMAAYGTQGLDTVDSVDMVVAGVDFASTTHPFLPPYSLETVIDEYALEPWVFEEGKLLAKPPMSGEITVDMPAPVGKVKAFLTLHSEIATVPVALQHLGVKRVTYRLGLPAEFHEKMKFLVDLGFGASRDVAVDGKPVNPRKMLAVMIDQHQTPESDPDDCEVVRVDIVGARNGKRVTVRMESTIYSHPKWKVSCGALDTGVPPSIVAQMIGLGVIQQRGVLAPESCVPADLFFLELAKRNIVIRRITDETLAEIPSAQRNNRRAAAAGQL